MKQINNQSLIYKTAILVLIACMSYVPLVSAQSLTLDKNRDTVILSPNECKEYIFKIKCEGCYANQDFSVSATGVDLPDDAFQLLTSNDDMTVEAGKTATVSILLRDKGANTYGKCIIVRIKNKSKKKDDDKVLYIYIMKAEEKKQQIRKNNENKLLYLNAGTFDFSTSNMNYVGHVNIFAPSVSRDKRTLFGVNTGIMKLNYWQNSASDTEQTRTRYENVRINPLKTLDSGSRYLKQINEYTTTTKTTDYSFYVQPLTRLFSKNDKGTQLYLHTHFELLVKRIETKTTISNMHSDTAIYIGNTEGKDIRIKDNLTNEYTNNNTYLNGYFGAGLTFNIVPWENGAFFFQPTIGITTDNHRHYNGPDREWNGFYLVRAYYTQKLSNDATAVLGADIRGLLPKYDPAYAAYIGINLSVESALKLIGINANKEEDKKSDSSK